jgi:polar amino acid transport system substrate-binding protein
VAKELMRMVRSTFFAAFFLCVSYCSYAADFIIGVEDIAYSPYFNFNTQEPSFSKDLLDKFAQDSGHKITYLPLPINQFSKFLFEEDVDFKFPDNRRWQEAWDTRRLDIYYSDDIVRLTAGTVILRKNQHRKQDFFKNIGIITGFLPTQWIEQLKQSNVKIIEDSSPKVLVNQLVHNIVDGLDIDLAVANYHLKELQVHEELVVSKNTSRQVFSYQLSSLKYPFIIEQFNCWLAQNHSFTQKLKQQYGIHNVEPDLVDINN